MGEEVECLGSLLPTGLTLVEDVHARLVSTDDFQDFGVQGEDPDNVPMMFQQFLCCLQLRDARGYHQSVLDFRFRGPVKGGVIDLCKDRGTQLGSPAQWWGAVVLRPEPANPRALATSPVQAAFGSGSAVTSL